jgi:hypothetical protein
MSDSDEHDGYYESEEPRVDFYYKELKRIAGKKEITLDDVENYERIKDYLKDELLKRNEPDYTDINSVETPFLPDLFRPSSVKNTPYDKAKQIQEWDSIVKAAKLTLANNVKITSNSLAQSGGKKRRKGKTNKLKKTKTKKQRKSKRKRN